MAARTPSDIPVKTKKGPANYYFNETMEVMYSCTDHSKTFKCRIEGTPRPQARSFATTTATNTKRVKLFDPSRDTKKSFTEAVVQAMAKAGATFDITNNSLPVIITMKFFFPHPKKHFIFNQKTNTFILSPTAPAYVTRTPDIDNCAKLAIDALQGIVCKNDSQVVELSTTKLYDHSYTEWNDKAPPTGCTLIKIVQLDQNSYHSDCKCAACMKKKKTM